MLKSDAIYLRHILDAAREAVSFTRGRSRGDMDRDRMLNLSLVRLLEIIGEAARSLSSDFRDDHPEIPWRKMSGMRDRLIHGYFDVDMDVVWQTVNHDLLPLIAQLEGLMRLEG